MSAARRPALDVRALPDHAFGHGGLIWWGTVGFMVIEGSMFLMLFVSYFFLRTRVDQWPPSLPYPDPTWGTVNLVLLLVSLIPNHMAKLAAERYDVPRIRLWLLVTIAFGLAVSAIRWLEFPALGARWDSNAYASIVWVLLGIHTLHLLTDTVDSMVLAALSFTSHMEPKRFVDFSENALYWDFIVLSWVAVYLVIYWGTRWL
jgi:cytochrome c oxidase subunit III